MISFIFGIFFKKVFTGRSLLLKTFFEALSVLFTIAVIYYASESFSLKTKFDNKESISLFAFLLVGEIALVLPMSFAERLIAHFLEIKHSQFYQSLLGLRISPLRLVFSKSLVDGLFPFARLNLILAFSYFVLNFHFSILGLFAFYVLQVFALLLFSFMAFITILLYLQFNKGIGLFYTLQSFAAIVGGAYFPISIFPTYLKDVSILLPQTQILRAARLLLQDQALEISFYLPCLIWLLLLFVVWFFLNSFLQKRLKLKARFF